MNFRQGIRPRPAKLWFADVAVFRYPLASLDYPVLHFIRRGEYHQHRHNHTEQDEIPPSNRYRLRHG